jgi:hypothetical protein
MNFKKIAVIGGVEFVTSSSGDGYNIYTDNEKGNLIDIYINASNPRDRISGYNSMVTALAMISKVQTTPQDIREGAFVHLPRPDGAILRIVEYLEDYTRITMEVIHDKVAAILNAMMRYLSKYPDIDNAEGSWCYYYRTCSFSRKDNNAHMPRSVNTPEKEQIFYDRYTWTVRGTIRRLGDDEDHPLAGIFVVDAECSNDGCYRIYQRKLQDVFQSQFCTECTKEDRTRRKREAMRNRRSKLREQKLEGGT